jgi:hypothetical protein
MSTRRSIFASFALGIASLVAAAGLRSLPAIANDGDGSGATNANKRKHRRNRRRNRRQRRRRN